MALPNVNITPIPDTDPDAVPSLWNTRYAEIDENFGNLDGRLTNQEVGTSAARDAVRFDWFLRGYKIALEQFTPVWRLYDPVSVAVISAVAGDDSVDVADTSDLEVGREYALYDGVQTEFFVVNEILSATRFTATSVLTNTFDDSAILAGTNWAVGDALAVAENDEFCIFEPVNVGDDAEDKNVIIRRQDNDATIKVYFKDDAHASWTECVLADSYESDVEGLIEEWFTLPGSGDITLKFVCEALGTADSVTLYRIGVINPSVMQTDVSLQGQIDDLSDRQDALETEFETHQLSVLRWVQ
jgi:hypothetical protein